MTTTTQARKTLADYNEGFRSYGETSDFETVREYRVGKWGVRWARDGYGSRGVGGDKRHVCVVTVVTAIKPDYNWQAYCAASTYGGSWLTREQMQKRREAQVASHGQYNHHCQQPKVGDVIQVNPVCRHNNVVGKGAWTPEELDTDAVDCLNCRREFFNEQVDGVEERRKEREAVEERKSAKPKPARCFWCGDIRPHTKATRAGEQLPCSTCKDDFTTIYNVETTGFEHDVSYLHDELERDAMWKARLLHQGRAAETQACERLERREGMYFRG